MDENVKRKLNILIYLAKVDGKFHKAEKALLKDFVKENNLDPLEFKALVDNPEKMEAGKISDKSEMLYLALKVIKADKHLDDKEMDFCKDLARKLGYNPEIINNLVLKDLSREAFDTEVKKWQAS